MASAISTGMGRKRRVFIVDDHAMVRQGLTLLIDREADLMVCGDAQEAHAALQTMATLEPDILIVDISLNGPDGLDLVKAVRSRSPLLPILVLSMHDESIYAERAIRAGTNGYIMKQEATDRMLIALRRILDGDIYLSERAASRIVQQYVRGSHEGQRSALSGLSDRELEVFRLIGEGHTTRHIADELHLSIKTVETYQAHIKEKLLLRNARELVQRAIEWHMAPAPR